MIEDPPLLTVRRRFARPTRAQLDAFALTPGDTARVALEEQVLRLRVEARSLQRDRNVGRRWKRALLLAELQARAAVGRLVPAGG